MSSIEEIPRTALHPRLEQFVDYFSREVLRDVGLPDHSSASLQYVDQLVGSSAALYVAASLRHSPRNIVVLTPDQSDAERFIDDLPLFATRSATLFPTQIDSGDVHEDTLGQRLRVLNLLSGGRTDSVIVCAVPSLLQSVPSIDNLRANSRVARVSERLDIEELSHWLIEQGYHATTAVELPGEFARRGGLLDVFPLDQDLPMRIELFGDDIESLRHFNVATQRSERHCQEIAITSLIASRTVNDANLLDYFPLGTLCILMNPDKIQSEAERFQLRHADTLSANVWASRWTQIRTFPCILASNFAAHADGNSMQLPLRSVERFSGEWSRVREELEAALNKAALITIACQTDGERKRLHEMFAESPSLSDGRIELIPGHLHEGFTIDPPGWTILGSAQLFQRSEPVRHAKRFKGQAIQSFLDLREGDYVVHLSHGIGRYLGLKEIHRQGQSEEHLEIEFHAGTRIFVPATRIDLVQKYVGGRKSRPQLAKIGGRLWQQQKHAAEAAVQDLAAELLEVQAERAARPGIVFAEDTEWQREFDAAFPYDETPDQLSAIDDIKGDLRSPRPMDRLLCGDVGYGKTELAMRAAFQAVDNGYQVALLAPTTILVEQHFNSFRQRMAEFPFQITKLSRFSSARDQRDSIRRLREGSVDIVIGTHRLASRDVEFQNLGLLIIDEEQRFGVEIKERLKRLRSTVNVLTLSATPIPRTLHMSLTGMRDISNLETPPAERLPVETRVVRWSDSLIRSAVLRELDRGGQIFFVHNRVQDIHNVAAKLQRIVPEARLGIGHGQMDEHVLERVMVDFISHKFDMLLATTIVESGLDIPNANTIFIDEAHRYGLAELHQLRGRVGRENRRAYCSLLIHERGSINPSAARRLQAIQEFSDMGAGFAIAMRDLEIRGAGNILGTQQSGHIATVGYELYCQLLEAAVRRLKRMPPQARPEVAIDLPGDIYIPREYVPDLRAKVDLYRRINQVDSYTAIEQLREEMRDRFGPLPDPVVRLLARAELKLDAAFWSVTKVRWESPFLLLNYRDSQRARQLGKRRGSLLRFVGQAELCCQLASDASSELLESTAKSLLQAT